MDRRGKVILRGSANMVHWRYQLECTRRRLCRRFSLWENRQDQLFAFFQVATRELIRNAHEKEVHIYSDNHGALKSIMRTRASSVLVQICTQGEDKVKLVTGHIAIELNERPVKLAKQGSSVWDSTKD